MPHYRSRAIWDEARKPNASMTSYLRALLYEIQPFRFTSINLHQIVQESKRQCLQIIILITFLSKALMDNGKTLSRRELKIFLVVAGYVYVVLYIHRIFEAGLLVIISTVLVLIFTIGLSDSNSNRNGTSAYSVFNSGYQQLLGSIDADNLVNQYAGGGLAAAPLVNRHEPQRLPPVNDDDNLVIEEEYDMNDAELQPHNGTTSRKSGKKARRRNIEQRREMQRQRQMAREFGIEGGDDEHLGMMQAAAAMEEE